LNAADLARAASLNKMRNDVTRAVQYNRLTMISTLSVAGTTPISLDAKVTEVMLAAAKDHLTAELTRLGVTGLEETK
jgi:hypothetical protein